MSPEMNESVEGTVGNLIHNSVFSPDEFFKGCVAFIAGLVGMPAAPLEMGLRPNFGTCFINPITMLVSLILFNTMAFFSATTELPGHHHLIGPGFSTGLLIAAFWGGCVYHAIRLWGRVQNMNRENDSEIEGPPLAFFGLLPHGDSYGYVRVFYEPGFAFFGSILLYFIGILPIVATGYFCVSAICLSLKSSIMWFGEWKHQRVVLDRKNRLPYMQKLTGTSAPAMISATPFVVSNAS